MKVYRNKTDVCKRPYSIEIFILGNEIPIGNFYKTHMDSGNIAS